MSAATRQLSTFRVADLLLGIEVERVQEVIRFQPMTRVPLAEAVVEGLINLRGQIVTAIDLRRRLDLAEREDGARPMNVVVRSDGEAVSLLVDEIGDVIEVAEELFEEPPETVRGTTRELIRGAYKLDDRLLLLLEVERAIAV